MGNQTSYTTQSTFTRRERDVLRGMAQGQSNREIAVSLGISEGAIGNYSHKIQHMLEDLYGVEPSRAKAVAWAKANGYAAEQAERPL